MRAKPEALRERAKVLLAEGRPLTRAMEDAGMSTVVNPDNEGVKVPEGWTVTTGPGHEGHGWYAHHTEYPDEGSMFLGRTIEEARAAALKLPIDDSDSTSAPTLAEKLAQAGVPGSMVGKVVEVLLSPDAPARQTLKFTRVAEGLLDFDETDLWKRALCNAIAASEEGDTFADLVTVADAAVMAFRARSAP